MNVIYDDDMIMLSRGDCAKPLLEIMTIEKETNRLLWPATSDEWSSNFASTSSLTIG